MDLCLSLSTLDAISPLLAAGGLAPDQLPGLGWFTNSIFVAIVVTVGVLLFTRMATRKMALVPGQRQNLVEYVVEFLYGQVESIVGKHVAPKVFPILATIFIFVLVANWGGLIPGVGTMGVGKTSATFVIDMDELSHFVPLLRPPTADLNFTLALAAVFMIVWAGITIREVGVWGFLVHTFGPKGGIKGCMAVPLIFIFLFVGVIEIISIAARPVSLSLRLFGNIYAGETLLHSMMEMGKSFGLSGFPLFVTSVIFPLPFYFMELLVGVLQATVFALLCAVYVKLSTAHDDEH